MVRAIDGLVNVDFGEREMPDWMTRVKDDYFGGKFNFESPELSQMLDEMDEHGVEKAILMCPVGTTEGRMLDFVEARPDRFALGVGGFDLLRPMDNIRRIEAYLANHPVAYLSVGPSFWGDGMYPPTDPVYFPLYTKCCEWEIPLCMNAGIPGPPIPAEPQNPIYLDRVCQRFPELKLSMIHGAEPWWDIAYRIIMKYRNVRLMTSAWSPKRLPQSLLHFMQTRGKDRIMFASDYPVLPISRVMPEALALDLPEDVLDSWLYRTADEFFFGHRWVTG